VFIYVSGSTLHGPTGADNRDALSAIELDLESGAMRLVEQHTGMLSPPYMVAHPHLPVLYVLERYLYGADVWGPTPESERETQRDTDAILAYRISPTDGRLTRAARAWCGGESPIHLQTTKDGAFALITNPGGKKDPDPEEGHVAVLGLGENGDSLDLVWQEHWSQIRPTWRKVRPKTCPHAAFLDPTEEHVFVPQLMSDVVAIYDFDKSSGKMTPSYQPFVSVQSGAGPRHIAVHPTAPFFYLVNSRDATISVVQHLEEEENWRVIQTFDAHPEGLDEARDLSHALVSQDGRFLYYTHRTDNSIGVASIDPVTGRLHARHRTATGGRRPRDFAFSSDGSMLVVANQWSDHIASFHVDADSGLLTATGQTLELFAPNCVVFGPEQAVR
jgi:6-phosphogluconolactonase